MKLKPFDYSTNTVFTLQYFTDTSLHFEFYIKKIYTFFYKIELLSEKSKHKSTITFNSLGVKSWKRRRTIKYDEPIGKPQYQKCVN